MKHHIRTGWYEAVHWLHDPAAWGRKAYRVRFPWLHPHFIPGGWLEWFCDRYDRALGMADEEIRRTRPTRKT